MIKNIMDYKITNLLIFWLIIVFSPITDANRIKDIATISGVRSNPLVGYGLVVGLDGTGDNTEFGKKSLKRMLSQFGINATMAEVNGMKNVAVVALHADLPAFAKPGQLIDVTVSAIGTAKSLRGGSLLLTPLKGPDNKVYAIAQGNLVVGGLGITADDGSSLSINVPVVGRIPNGASIERTAPSRFLAGNHIIFNLNRSDFTTAKRLADRINLFLGSTFAHALDSTSVKVKAPMEPSQRVTFLSTIENLTLAPGDAPAKVIINSRTGTIVIGQHVVVSPAAVTHGNLIVSVSESKEFKVKEDDDEESETIEEEFKRKSDITVTKDKGTVIKLEQGASLDELVKLINQVGASPGDLMSVLEALKEAGALNAELVVI